MLSLSKHRSFPIFRLMQSSPVKGELQHYQGFQEEDCARSMSVCLIGY